MKTDPRLMWLFMRELEVQCRFALLAFDGLTRLPDLVPVIYPRENNDPMVHPLQPWRGRARGIPTISGRWLSGVTYYTESDELAFFLAHAFLTHAAAVSRILDPPAPKHSPFTREERKARAVQLTKELRVEVPSLTGKPARLVRNSLEHADERLEVWFQTPAGQRLDLVDMNHMPFGHSSISAPPADTEFFRTLGGHSLSFRFGTQLQSLDTMATELRRLLHAVVEWQVRSANEPIESPPAANQ